MTAHKNPFVNLLMLPMEYTQFTCGENGQLKNKIWVNGSKFLIIISDHPKNGVMKKKRGGSPKEENGELENGFMCWSSAHELDRQCRKSAKY